MRERASRVYGTMSGMAMMVYCTMRGRDMRLYSIIGVGHGGMWHHEGKGNQAVWHHEGEGHHPVWHHYVKVGSVMVTDDPVLAMRSIHGIQNIMNKADKQRKWLNQRQQSKLSIASTSRKHQSKLLLNRNLYKHQLIVCMGSSHAYIS